MIEVLLVMSFFGIAAIGGVALTSSISGFWSLLGGGRKEKEVEVKIIFYENADEIDHGYKQGGSKYT